MIEWFKKHWKLIVATPISFIIAIAVWAADTRYMTIEKVQAGTFHEQFITIGGLQKFANDSQIEVLAQEVQDLTLKVELGYASEWEKALLEQRKIELYNKQQGVE